jgi:hypothetical protein
MRLVTDRSYRFPFSQHEFWRRISNVDDFQTWWPWLRTFDADRLGAGDVWACAVHPPLPYVVRFEVALDEVVSATLIAGTISGDIVGRAELSIESDGSAGCAVRLVADLSPAKQALRVMSLAARPMVRFGHNWVMDVGVRQFLERSSR